jgi:hypothetical protein
MQFRITIDVFSGRTNPVIEVKGREADRIYERLRPAQHVSKIFIPEAAIPPGRSRTKSRKVFWNSGTPCRRSPKPSPALLAWDIEEYSFGAGRTGMEGVRRGGVAQRAWRSRSSYRHSQGV